MRDEATDVLKKGGTYIGRLIRAWQLRSIKSYLGNSTGTRRMGNRNIALVVQGSIIV